MLFDYWYNGKLKIYCSNCKKFVLIRFYNFPKTLCCGSCNNKTNEEILVTTIRETLEVIYNSKNLEIHQRDSNELS